MDTQFVMPVFLLIALRNEVLGFASGDAVLDTTMMDELSDLIGKAMLPPNSLVQTTAPLLRSSAKTRLSEVTKYTFESSTTKPPEADAGSE